MKRFLIFLAAVASGAVCLLVTPDGYVGTHLHNTKLHALRYPTMGLGRDRDDPDGRAAWELLRTRDPKTGKLPDDIHHRELAYAYTMPQAESALLKTSAAPPDGWTQRGPRNVGGRTRAVGIDLGNENVMLAGGASGGMWRSQDAGRTWLKTTPPNQIQSVTCLTQDPRPGKRNVWYYGTGEVLSTVNRKVSTAFRSVGVGDGVFKSSDGGQTWRQLASTAGATPQGLDKTFEGVWSIAIDQSNTTQDEVYAACYGAIMRSVDGGVTWSMTLGDTVNRSLCTDVVVASNGVVYAALSQLTLTGAANPAYMGIWRSTNGTNWTRITPAGFTTNYRRIRLALAPSDQSVLYLLAETPADGVQGHSIWKYTYVSGDGSGAGGRWEDRSAVIPTTGLVSGFYSLGSYCLTIAVKPDDPNTVFFGGTSLYRTTDGFTNAANVKQVGGYALVYDPNKTGLSAILYPGHHPDLHTILFSPGNPNRMFTGDDGGVQRTDACAADSVMWAPLNTGYFTSQVYSVALDHATAFSQTVLIGLQDNGSWIDRTGDVGKPWLETSGGDGCYCAIADGGNPVYTSSQFGNVYRFIYDGAGAIQNFDLMTTTDASPTLFVSPFIIDPAQNTLMFLGGDTTLWRCPDLSAIPPDNTTGTAQYWDSVSAAGTGPAGYISALGMSPAGGKHRLYYGTANGRVYRLDNAGSQNPGPPRLINGPAFPAGGFVSCIAVHPNNANIAIVSFGNYNVPSVFMTIDAGATWQNISGNLEENPDGSGAGPSVRWINILPGDAGDLVFAGTTTGLYVTEIFGVVDTVWGHAGTIGFTDVESVDSRWDGSVVVGTYGHGVFSSFYNVGAVPRGGNAPEPEAHITLSPNPAHGRCTLRASLPGAGTQVAAITITDMAGRIRQRRTSGLLTDGMLEQELDLRGLEPGTYICTVRRARGGTANRTFVVE